MAQLKYHGPYDEHPQEVMNLIRSQEMVEEASQSEADVIAEVNEELSDKAERSYVDAQANRYASVSDVDSAFSGKLSENTLGQSVAALDENRRLLDSYLPPVVTRTSQFFSFQGSMSNQFSTTGSPVAEMARLTVNNSAQRYMVLAWAQIEAFADDPNQTPGLEIVSSAGTSRLSYGVTGTNYAREWLMIEAHPTNFNTSFSGSNQIILRTFRGGTGGSRIQYSAHEANFCALTIPITT